MKLVHNWLVTGKLKDWLLASEKEGRNYCRKETFDVLNEFVNFSTIEGFAIPWPIENERV